MQKVITVYICGAAFDHEIDVTDVKVYPTIEALKEDHPSTDECGIYELHVTLNRVISKPTN